MKTKPSPSLYRYVKSRRSTFSISILVPALYVRSTTLPLDDVLELGAHERAALAGLDVLELDDVPELSVDVEDDAVLDVIGRCHGGQAYPAASATPCRDAASIADERRARTSRSRTRRSRRVATPRDDARCAGTSSRACGLRDVHLDQRQAGLRDHRRRIPQRVAVVRERRRVQDDGARRVDRLMEPADQLGLVVGLPQVDLDAVGGLARPASRASADRSARRRPRARGCRGVRDSDRSERAAGGRGMCTTRYRVGNVARPSVGDLLVGGEEQLLVRRRSASSAARCRRAR